MNPLAVLVLAGLWVAERTLHACTRRELAQALELERQERVRRQHAEAELAARRTAPSIRTLGPPPTFLFIPPPTPRTHTLDELLSGEP